MGWRNFSGFRLRGATWRVGFAGGPAPKACGHVLIGALRFAQRHPARGLGPGHQIGAFRFAQRHPTRGLRSRACWCASLRSTAPYVGAWAGTTDRCASLRSTAPYGAAGGRVRLAALGSILWSFQWVWRNRVGVRLIAGVGHGLVEGVCVVQALELRVVQVVGLGGDACLFAGFGEDELVRP